MTLLCPFAGFPWLNSLNRLYINMSIVLTVLFMQFLPRLVHLALQSCNLDDGTAFELADSDGDDNLGGALSSDDDEDGDDNKRVRNFSVRTGVLDEKAAATQALGLFALHTKGAFQPYLEEALKVMQKHAGYFHEDVRIQAVLAYQRMLLRAHYFHFVEFSIPLKLDEAEGRRSGGCGSKVSYKHQQNSEDVKILLDDVCRFTDRNQRSISK